jgi:hypothetical protein
MTPKEKAKELYNKYWILTPQPFIERVEYYNESKLIFNDWDKDWTNKYAKQCALIAVDEILNSNPNYPEFKENEGTPIRYWEVVKQEIEKL